MLNGGEVLPTTASGGQRDGEVDVATARQVQLADLGVRHDDHRTVDAGELPDERQHGGADRELVAPGRIVDGEPLRVRARQHGEVGGDGIGVDGVGGQLGEAPIVRAAFGKQFDDPLPRVRDRQERTFGGRLVLGDAIEDLVGCGDEAEDASVAGQAGDVVGVEHQAAAGRDHQSVAGGELGGEFALDLSESFFPSRSEDLGNLAVALLDQLIGVDELVAEMFGEEATDGRLASAHETGEHDVAGISPVHRWRSG